MTIPLSKLYTVSASKPPGWLKAALESGKLRGDHLHVSGLAWAKLGAATGQWGDVVGVVAKPIAKALHLSPGCGGCAKRGKVLNRGGELV